MFDFLAPVKAWPNLCRYEPQLADMLVNAKRSSKANPANEAETLHRKGGWGDGTINLPNTPKYAPPKMMHVRKCQNFAPDEKRDSWLETRLRERGAFTLVDVCDAFGFTHRPDGTGRDVIRGWRDRGLIKKRRIHGKGAGNRVEWVAA